MQYVQFEIQTVLSRIKEYKKNDITPHFQQVFKTATLNSLLELNEDDDIQLAIVISLSKIIYYLQDQEMFIKVIDYVAKIQTPSQLLITKKLKFIRNCFEQSLNTTQTIEKLYKMNKQIEEHPQILIKELARDQISQSLKSLAKSCSMEILTNILQELTKDINTLLFQKPQDYVKLIDYPFQIIQFIVSQRIPQDYIQGTYIPLLVLLARQDSPYLWNQIFQAGLQIINFGMEGKFEDVLETRTILGQVILNYLSNHIKKLKSLQPIELIYELDSHFVKNNLNLLFQSRENIQYLYLKSDHYAIVCPIFEEIISLIFELSNILSKIETAEAKQYQKMLYELQVSLFQNGQTKKSTLNQDKLHQFVAKFNEPEPGPRKLINQITNQQFLRMLKYCTKLQETQMKEILGYHKEDCIALMKQYVKTFDYTGLSVVEGLRLLASNFLLFGESQMIERVLDEYTKFYYSQNKQNTVFKNSDCMFTYTYAIILLNTDLYNKTLQKHMTLEDYIKNCAKINDNENLPEEVLRKDYFDIASNEIKCARDLAKTENFNYFVWEQYVKYKEVYKQNFQELISDFEIQQDPEHYGDIILTQMTKNIEEMISQVTNLDDLTEFLNQVLQVCVKNDKFENAKQILTQMLKVLQDKDPQPLKVFTCFFIADNLLPYMVDFTDVILLIRKTILMRHKQQTDSVSQNCRQILIKLYTNNKFIKKEMGSNQGIISLFQKFLQQEDAEESDEEMLSAVESQGSKYPEMLINIINQTRYLEKERLTVFLDALIQQINLNNQEFHYIIFAQIIFIAVEILRVNTDRLLSFWPVVVSILNQDYNDKIKKKGIQKLVESFCNFITLKLSVEFFHLGDKLDQYNVQFDRGLKYLQSQSLEIQVEFLIEVQQFLKQNQIQDCQISHIQNIFQLLKSILGALEQKNLDQNDAKIILNLYQDILERIQMYDNEQTLVICLKLQSDFLNSIFKQKQLCKVDKMPDFIATNLIQIIKSYEKFIHEQNNDFLIELLSLAITLQNDYIPKIVQIMIQVTLNINYQQLNQQGFNQLYQKSINKMYFILQTKNEQIITSYTQLLLKIYFNWITKERFNLDTWLEFFNKIGAIIHYTKINKLQQMYENITLTVQSSYNNPHFQELIKGTNYLLYQNNKIIKKFQIALQQRVNIINLSYDYYLQFMLNQSQAKKVKNIYVELVPSTLLNKNIIETRKGLYESESCRKQDAIIKILQVQGSTIAMSNVKEIKLQASLHQMAKQSELQSDYIVQCLSIQKTRSSFYYAFERLKYNLNDYLKAQNELDLLYLVDSLIQALKYLQKYGNHHGNLKPTNIFFFRKVGDKPIFKVSDFYLSENRQNDFISPEVKNGEKSNIASDIYSIGMICLWFTGRLGDDTKKLTLSQTVKSLIDSMIKPTMDRITFQDLSDTVERLIESFQLELNKQDYISRGLNQQKITQMIQEREQKQQYRDVREFAAQENKFSIRNKGQFYYLISEMIRPLKVNDYHLNQLIISSIFVSYQCYSLCLKMCNQDGSDFLFQSLLQDEIQQLEEYIYKVKLMIEIYCMDLQLQGIDIDIMKSFLNDKIDPYPIFRQALNKIVKEILDTNIIKKLQYEIKDKEQIKALNIIKYINMMNDGQYYDYKEIIIYISQQDTPI